MVVVFIIGGSISSLGKGIAASALGALLRADGYRIRLRKFDPYLNVDPGTMSPYQHGEVFVTQDGGEVDLDFGSYERFTNVASYKTDSLSSGKIYSKIIDQERQGIFLGQTIQVVPHITQAIAHEMTNSHNTDVLICEIGGTVGDMEIQPFLEAIRQVRQQWGLSKTLVIHMGWVPFFSPSGEVKTKLIQHSTKELLHSGIQPDVLIARCDKNLSKEIRQKIALFCNVSLENVIDAPTVNNIYETIPLYHQNGLDKVVYKHFGFQKNSSKNLQESSIENVTFSQTCLKANLENKGVPLSCWQQICYGFQHHKHDVSIAVVGKYVHMDDAYRSLLEALTHGGLVNETKVNVHMIDAEKLESSDDIVISSLKEHHGILVPGGFGHRGIEGMIKSITYGRQNKVPFFGICLGMQLAVIEAFRTLNGFEKATSSEFVSPQDIEERRYPFVVALLKEWMTEGELQACQKIMGGTMRLGTYPSYLRVGSQCEKIYGKSIVYERHRHRYEVNGAYYKELEKTGLLISGLHPKEKEWNEKEDIQHYFKTMNGLVEAIERPDHPWFIAVQSHPEFLSRPFSPHPLFASFIKNALEYKNKMKQ